MPLSKHEVKERLGYGALTQIAKATGRALGHVSQVVNGKRPDRKVARAIARRLRLKLIDLPPEYIGLAPAEATDDEERGAPGPVVVNG